MKKLAFLLVSLVYLSSLYAAKPFTTTHFDLIYTNNTLASPVDTAKLSKAVKISLIKGNWKVTEETASYIMAEFDKDDGAISATIKIAFTGTGYQIEYVKSQGLNVNLKTKVIHKNYVRWIKNLMKQIALNYL